MPHELIVETITDQYTIKFRLSDEHGVQKASHEVRLTDHHAALWEGLFDTRRHVDRYEGSLLWEDASEPETADRILGRLGVFLGNAVLGQEIMDELTRTRQRRTLLVRLPPTGDDVLAAAFARVPWEIARPALTAPALMERNLVVRVITEDTAQRDAAVAAVAAKVASGETLRVLLVFAEAPGSRPLAMRQERQELLNLFYQEILPKKQVQVDALCHGVTRAVLTEQIRAANGYHIVHWSGHGHHNLLELRGEDGTEDLISGEELVTLFEEAGGFIPQLVFLSACLSGTFVRVQDWASFQALLLDKGPDRKQAQAPVLPDILANPAGYTGTALALLRCGVPQVIAMRYEVGDAYARQLAWWFYKRLLADPGRPPTDGALALARTDLLKDPQKAARLGAVNHATPLMFGQAGRLLDPVAKRSPQMKRLRPQPQPLLPAGNRDLDPTEHFVGRGAELTRLNVAWLGPDGPAVALVQGLAGMGKTALAAEAIHLWHGRFDYVLAFQAKPTALMVDEFYRQMDAKLTLVSQPYRDKCESSPFARVYLEPRPRLSGEARYERMRVNLIEALRDEALLLVLDNFETNLDKTPELIAGVWSGKTVEDEQLEQLRRVYQLADQLPEALRQELPEIPPELKALMEQPAEAPDAPPIGPLLAELNTAGLVTGAAQDPSDDAAYTFHELVRERIAAWMHTHAAEQGGRTEEQVWVAYGERYAALFKQLQRSGQEGARAAAAEAGRRGLTYLVRAGAFDRLGSFASGLVTGTRDPTLLRGVIAELRAVADQVPAGEERWSMRTYLADAVWRSGRPDQSLALYEQAAAEAEAAEDWSDVGWICMNWANALGDVGQLDRAKAMRLRGAEAEQKAGRARVHAIGSELEALRIDVRQGKAREALPEIEARLQEVRGWWQRHRAGEAVPDAPDPVFLGRALVSGLDIAQYANRQLKRWEACLALLEEQEHSQREMGESKHEQYWTRYNQYGPLIELGRLDDAQRVVEECLAVFREADDLYGQAKALYALASIWNERGDIEQAIALGRQALSVCNRLPDPSDRAISHHNLAVYYGKAGRAEDEARHRLAAGVYLLVSTRHDHLATWLHNLSIRVRRAAQSGGRYDLPRLADLLARPEFEALGRFLAQRGVDARPLQAQLDQLVEQARQDGG
jgi:tetratricopeptide (TPR) repeat protein